MKNKFSLINNTNKLFPLIFLLFISGCKDDSVSDPSLEWYDQTTSGYYSLANEHIIVIRNFIGPVIVNGEISAHPSLRWFLYKKVEAESEEKANEIFPLISPEFQKKGDTIFVTLNSSMQLYLDAGIELDLPDTMVCRIEQVKGNALINYMDSLLVIQNASNVDVNQHSGSCEISSITGNISVETALPLEGFCRINVGTGNIFITIPANTSATVYAKSIAGSVSQSGLTITNIQQASNSITGTLGEGNGEIRAETNVGNIILQAL